MAHGFKDVFGDLLITAPLSPNESALPSPNQLKRKIIIKVTAVDTHIMSMVRGYIEIIIMVM